LHGVTRIRSSTRCTRRARNRLAECEAPFRAILRSVGSAKPPYELASFLCFIKLSNPPECTRQLNDTSPRRHSAPSHVCDTIDRYGYFVGQANRLGGTRFRSADNFPLLTSARTRCARRKSLIDPASIEFQTRMRESATASGARRLAAGDSIILLAEQVGKISRRLQRGRTEENFPRDF
jgi:hypothetical protein